MSKLSKPVKEIYRWVLKHGRPLHRDDSLGCIRTLKSHPHIYMDEADDHGMIICYCIISGELVQETIEERVFNELKKSSDPARTDVSSRPYRKKRL